VHDRAELARGEVVPQAVAAGEHAVADLERSMCRRAAADPAWCRGSRSAGSTAVRVGLFLGDLALVDQALHVEWSIVRLTISAPRKW
jgi:hypothetical protein